MSGGRYGTIGIPLEYHCPVQILALHLLCVVATVFEVRAEAVRPSSCPGVYD